jgi:hypothetical protein
MLYLFNNSYTFLIIIILIFIIIKIIEKIRKRLNIHNILNLLINKSERKKKFKYKINKFYRYRYYSTNPYYKMNYKNRMIIRYLSVYEQIKQNIINIKNKYKLGKYRFIKDINNKHQQKQKQKQKQIKPTNFGFVIKNSYPVIKHLINIYGPQAIGILAKFVENYVDIFYVANISDGITLRNYNIKKPIMVLYYIDPSDIYNAEKYELQIVIPSIKYINLIIDKIDYKIKGHLWFDSNMGKEGTNNSDELLTIYDFIKKNKKIQDKIQILGIGTKYNTSDIRFKTNKKLRNIIPKDIIDQHLKFKLIVKQINDPNLIVHSACTFEVSRNFKDSFFDSVRVGSLVYRKIIWSTPILGITYKKRSDCLGYYCEESPNLNDSSKSNKLIKIGLLKNTFRSTIETKIFAQSKYSNDLTELKVVLSDYDPLGVIIPSNIDLDVGDYLTVISNDLYTYK